MKYIILFLLLSGCSQVSNPCINLGCPEETKVVASIEGEVYHDCSSHFAKRISIANLACFSSIKRAEELGFRPSAEFQKKVT